MVKVNGPMLSLSASGTIANTATFGTWKGRPYVRQRVVPTNPREPLQVAVRSMFRFLSQNWAAIGATPKASWDDRAEMRSISPFNAYMGVNQTLWREFKSPSQTDPKPGTGTEPVATFDSATPGDGFADLTMTITTKNDVWGAMIFRSPTGTFTPSLSTAIAFIPVDATGTLVYTDSGLDAGTYYYDVKFFTKEGVLGADEGEKSAVVT